jgi:hypothetical protein
MLVVVSALLGALILQPVTAAVTRQYVQAYMERLAPEQTYIHRQASGSMTTNTAWTAFPGAALAGYPAQNIAYTVPAGKTFYLFRFWANIDSTVSLGREYGLQMSLAGTGTYWLSGQTTTVWRGPEITFTRARPITAGTAITIQYRCSNTNTHVVVGFEGIEETP